MNLICNQSYPEYKKSFVKYSSNIPTTWEQRRGKYLFRENILQSESGEEELLTVSHISGITPRRTKNVSMFKAESTVGYKICRQNDIAINTMWAWMGAVAVSRYYGVVSPSYHVYTTITNDYNLEYLDYLLRTSLMVDNYKSRSTGLRPSRLRLYPDKFLDIVFPIPPRQEQDQIVKYLDQQMAKINRFIKAKKKLIAVLKEQIECYVYGNDAEFSENINSWESSFPKEWKMLKASRLTVERNIKNKGEYELLAVTQDRGVVLKKDCEQNYVSPAGDLSGLKLVSNGDYVISLRSFQGGIEYSNVEGIVSPAYNIFSLVNDYESEEYKHYYKQLFKTKAFISLLNTVVSGIRDGKNINYSDFSKLLLPVPPQNVASKVYKLSLKIDKMQKEYNAEYSLLKEYRDALVSDVVTGKVDVRNIVIDESEEEIIEDLEFEEDSLDEESLEAEGGDE